MATISPPVMARVSRSTAAPMSLRWVGSGRSSRKVGLRNRSAASAPTPRAASSRPTISGSRSCWAKARPARSSPARWRQRRPHSERSTPRKAGDPSDMAQDRRASRVASMILSSRACRWAAGRLMIVIVVGLALEIVLRLDEAHRAGLGAHHYGMSDCARGEAAHALQHGPAGDAGRREHDVALGQVEQVVFAIEVGDAEALGAAALV